MLGPHDDFEALALLDDHALAARLASIAGEQLVDLRSSFRGASWRLMDDGDLLAHRYLVGALAVARPADAVLSEEGAGHGDRRTTERVWIVDPLDGTNEFGEGDRPDWAVHVALTERGTPIAGAVALPAVGQVLATSPAPVVPPIGQRRVRVVTSRWRAPWCALAVADALDAEMLHVGSAGAKAMAVVLGHADVYVHAGGMYEWDSCAPAAVASAAGLHTSRIDGSSLVYNRPDPWMPDLLICRRELAHTCLEVLWR